MKRILLSCLLLLFLLISGCALRLDGYTEISYSKLMKKIEKGESFPLVIGSSDCSACANYEITMNSFIKKHRVEVFMIDLIGLSDEEYNNLKTQTSFSGTPTTVFYKEGKLTSFYNRIDGSESMSAVEDYFKANGYIE